MQCCCLMWSKEATSIQRCCNKLAEKDFTAESNCFGNTKAILHSRLCHTAEWMVTMRTASSLIILKRTILQKESEAPISSWKEELRYFSQLGALCFFVRVSTNVKYYEIPSNLQWWQGNTTTCLQKWSQWTQRAEFLISMTFTWDFNL